MSFSPWSSEGPHCLPLSGTVRVMPVIKEAELEKTTQVPPLPSDQAAPCKKSGATWTGSHLQLRAPPLAVPGAAVVHHQPRSLCVMTPALAGI